MNWIIKFLSIRRIILLVLMLGLFIYYVPNWYIGSKISEITGTSVTAKFSLLELLRGNVVFKKLIIGSPSNFGATTAVTLDNFKINVTPLSLFSSETKINSISADQININSIFAENSNSINEIINNANAYFGRTKKTNNSCIIDEIFLRNIHLKTYYYSNTPVSTVLPNIYLKKISGKSDLTETVSEILAATFSSNINNDYEKNISWWDKTTHAIGAGVNFSVNVLGTGLNLTKNTVDTANSVNSTMGRVKNSVSKW